VELERLLEQHLVLHAPLVRKRREVGQVLQADVTILKIFSPKIRNNWCF
jgi:hypothetical protein